MANFSQVRRILRLHPAHRTVGISGVASSFRPCYQFEPPSAIEPASAPMRVLLVSDFSDHRTDVALTAFERILLDRRNVRCRRVDLASADRKHPAGADCAVVFGLGLQIIGHWTAFKADAETAPVFAAAKAGQPPLMSQTGDRTAMKIEVADAARWHPVLDGVGPFIASHGIDAEARPHMNSTYLLIRRMADRVVPVAWARHGENRAVHTLLGHAEDFRQPEFTRLLLNALDWVRR
jgi:hypothetical protein